MKSSCLRFSAVLALVAIFGLVDRAAAGDNVPFKGNLEGTYTATPVDPNEPLVLNAHLVATGNATHIGAFTFDFPHIVDRRQRPSTGKGKATFTAANGDKIFADVNGEATLVVPGLLHALEWGTITGGTGRFANASGSFVVERLIDQIGFTTVGAFEGSISSPGVDLP